MRQWRLIYDIATTGIRNMAIDEAILAAVCAGAAPPTLRFYRWSPPCLSLGYGQKAADADVSRIDALGWQMVRRMTGGRAILHTDELTYSLTVPDTHPLAAGDVVASYRRISQALAVGLHALGAAVEADRRAQSIPSSGAVCFETPSHYEITAQGRKLIGSAQIRRRGGLLQHGSLPLYGDLGRICDVLVYADDSARAAARQQVYARALTLSQALNGRQVIWETAAEALAQAFANTFDLALSSGSLTEAEYTHAEHLADTVYAGAQWTFKR